MQGIEEIFFKKMESYFPEIEPLMKLGSASQSSVSFCSPKRTIFCSSFVCSEIRVKNPNSGALIHESYWKDNNFIGYKKRIILKQSPFYIFNNNDNK